MARCVLGGFAAGALVLLTAGMAVAQGDADFSRPGAYFQLGFSYAKESFDVKDVEKKYSDVLNDIPDCPSQQCEVHVLVDRTDSLGGDFRAGYRIHPMFAAELNFQYYDNFDLKLGGKTKDFADIRMYNFFLNGKFFPIDGVLQPYLEAGIGGVYADVDTDPVTITRTFARGPGDNVENSVSSEGGHNSGPLFGGRIGGGLDYYVTRNIVVNFDISYTLTTKFDADGLPADISLNHVPITLGVQYRL